MVLKKIKEKETLVTEYCKPKATKIHLSTLWSCGSASSGIYIIQLFLDIGIGQTYITFHVVENEILEITENCYHVYRIRTQVWDWTWKGQSSLTADGA